MGAVIIWLKKDGAGQGTILCPFLFAIHPGKWYKSGVTVRMRFIQGRTLQEQCSEGDAVRTLTAVLKHGFFSADVKTRKLYKAL